MTFLMYRRKTRFRFENVCRRNYFCILHHINTNILWYSYKSMFLNNKYVDLLIQTRPTQIENSIILIENLVSIGFLRIVVIQNQLPFNFGTASVCNRLLKVRNTPPLTHKLLTFNFLLHIKPNQRWFENSLLFFHISPCPFKQKF